ncbi:MAG: hypothetical protein KH231_06350 [Dialister sp.]|uniref:hypothetical protein n=1 Tax=Dialister sp. TaxID=1955814 RepID=UPI001D99C6E0|nr:hypothetical protein [Dialister sp.]MBS6715078.1 hypothetical protein [Dialister sp.]
MAEQTFKGLLQLNSKPYTVAQSENKVLRAGEPLAVTITGDDSSAGETVTMLKIGDGTTPFNDLPWLSGLASDVYDWALQPEKPTYSLNEINTDIKTQNLSINIHYNDDDYGLIQIQPGMISLAVKDLAGESEFAISTGFVSMTEDIIASFKEKLGIDLTQEEADSRYMPITGKDISSGVFSISSQATLHYGKKVSLTIGLGTFKIQDESANTYLSITPGEENPIFTNETRSWLKALGLIPTAENQILLSDSLDFKAVNLVGTDYSTIRPRGTRIVSTVDEAANTPEGCFSAVIGG